jgi:hypothetical protein
MARTKQLYPMQREPSEVFKRSNGAIDTHMRLDGRSNGFVKEPGHKDVEHKQPGLPQLLVCVGGIYMSLYVHSQLLRQFKAPQGVDLGMAKGLLTTK